jgi:dTDP-4-dehydrorhamnose 3,5-epimerase
MKFIKTQIPDIVIIEPVVHGDSRGYFSETFRADQLQQALGYKVNFVQDNESKSSYGILRGLHYQLPPYAQSKLVRVISGRVLDVAVDIRRGSPTFAQHVSVELSDVNRHQLFIPRGFAHGFVVLSDEALFSYKVDNYYSPECDRGMMFNDPELAIDWQMEQSILKLSEKDTKQPPLSKVKDFFDYDVNYYS